MSILCVSVHGLKKAIVTVIVWATAITGLRKWHPERFRVTAHTVTPLVCLIPEAPWEDRGDAWGERQKMKKLGRFLRKGGLRRGVEQWNVKKKFIHVLLHVCSSHRSSSFPLSCLFLFQARQVWRLVAFSILVKYNEILKCYIFSSTYSTAVIYQVLPLQPKPKFRRRSSRETSR